MSTNKLSNKIRGALFVFLAVFTITSTGWAATYYVSTTGNDSNPGTSPQPWKTIQKAANTMVAGDTVTVAAGDYPERVTETTSGSAGLPITYLASGTVTMQGFTIDSANYVTINGFHITAAPDNSVTGWGIYYYHGHDGIIENNHVIYCTRGGIELAVKSDGSANANTSDCIVRNNELERNEQVGINVNGRNHLIESNEAWIRPELTTAIVGEYADIIAKKVMLTNREFEFAYNAYLLTQLYIDLSAEVNSAHIMNTCNFSALGSAFYHFAVTWDGVGDGSHLKLHKDSVELTSGCSVDNLGTFVSIDSFPTTKVGIGVMGNNTIFF